MAPSVLAAGLTRSAANPLVLQVSPDMGVRTPALLGLFYRAIEPLLHANRGLKVNLMTSWLRGDAAVSSMLAGNGPDIWGDYVITQYTTAGVALDLTKYVKQDNLDLGIFQKGQMQYIRQAGALDLANPGGLYALPAVSNFTTNVVNLGVLDQLGLKYPQPDWTYADYAKLWRATARKAQGTTTPQRYGGTIDWRGYDHTYSMISPFVLWAWGGEYVNPGNQTRSYLDSAASVACGEWAYDLVYSGAATVNGGPVWEGDSNFQQATVVQQFQDSGDLIAAANYKGLKWDFFPIPAGPTRTLSYTVGTTDGIWAGTKNPDAAWLVLKWLTTNLAPIRIQMQALLATPARLDLFEEWAQVVRRVAPPLRDKNLEVYVDQAKANNQYIGGLFKYSNSGVQNIVNNVSNLLWSRKVTVSEGFRMMARQINALQAAGQRESAAATSFARRYVKDIATAAVSSGSVRLPAPPRKGTAGPAPVADAAQVTQQAGVWSVTGGGSGVAQSTDGLTFACAASTASKASFVCRITSITAVKPDTIQSGAKFGLMARGDLGESAASLGVEVSAGRGVHAHVRPTSGETMSDYRAGSAPGLLSSSAILLDNSKPAKNYLTKPVWLKLERDVNVWNAYTSLDGATWQPAAGPIAAEVLGVWVGLYVTAHNSGTLVRATFDHLQGFTPDTFARIGAP